MITNLDGTSALFLANVSRIQQKLDDANQQLASGKKLNSASDAPDQVGVLLQLRTNEQRNSQIQSNLTLAETDATSADDTLSDAIQLMDRAVSLAAQGANSSMDAQSRQSLALQVEAIQQAMVADSRAQVQGNYIFSGDQPGAPAYQIDLNAAKGVDELSNAAATRVIEDPTGGRFTASETAQQIFDETDANGNPTANNVFAALNNLRLALMKNDQPGVTNSVSALKQASDHLNDMQAFYGGVETRIQNASDFAGKYDVQLQTEISNTEDADPTTAAMNLTQANSEMQAAFQMEGLMPRKSLFEYLA